MPREWLLLIASVAVTIVVGLALVRSLAPELLGIAPDLREIQLDEKVPAFFENVFRPEHGEDEDLILLDPLTRVRGRPFMPPGNQGPTDILGFRNFAVPHQADVVTLGDSQTFGLNAPLQRNWPSLLGRAIGRPRAVYNMAMGGWSGVQYLEMFRYARFFQPRVVVVAFYSGNDPPESHKMVYAQERWEWLRSGKPGAAQRPPLSQPEQRAIWAVTPPGGQRLQFRPLLRLYSNRDHPAIDEGWEILARTGRQIASEGVERGVAVVLTVIPTKELVYEKSLRGLGVALSPDYDELVTWERRRIQALADRLADVVGATYVDVLGPLEQALLDGTRTHPPGIDGHPLAAGYRVIAEALAPAVAKGLGTRERPLPGGR